MNPSILQCLLVFVLVIGSIQRAEGFIAVQYIGCLKDRNRFLNVEAGNVVVDVEDGITQCLALGQTYVGIGDGTWCGNAYGNETSSECIILCANNTQQRCGGIYSVQSVFAVCIPGSYQGVAVTSLRCPYQCGHCSLTVCHVLSGACLSQCEAGWTGPKCDQGQALDINECVGSSLNSCSQICNSSVDSSCFCPCQNGYILNVDKPTCKDQGFVPVTIPVTVAENSSGTIPIPVGVFIACVVVLAVFLIAFFVAFVVILVLYRRLVNRTTPRAAAQSDNTAPKYELPRRDNQPQTTTDEAYYSGIENENGYSRPT